jgi:mannitol/fructose-specific phosphotransferase system IIA component (Ntr-type)
MHLKALAKISRMLKDGNFRRRLMGVESQQEIYDMVVDNDEEL